MIYTESALRKRSIGLSREIAEFLEDVFCDDPHSDKYEVGLNIDNVYVVFDGNGQLAVIARFFVSWQ